MSVPMKFLSHTLGDIALPSTIKGTMCISFEDIMAIFKVVERVDEHEMAQINILDIIISFKRIKPFHEEVYMKMLTKYHEMEKSKGDMKKLFYFIINQIRNLISFENFTWILIDAGYRDLSKCIQFERNGVSLKGPSKRELPHADTVNEYFSGLKRCVDNNALQDGPRYRLECFINLLNKKSSQCTGYPGRYQLLIDKRVMVYFLLAQQYSDMDKRLDVLKRMRDSMPQDVDRTLFDTIYHSYMTVIWSIKDNPVTAERHEQCARYACQSCVPGLASIVLGLCAQYKNNVFYFRRHNSNDLEHATTNFEEVFQMFDYVKDDPKIYGTIALLEMVHTLLGIDWDLNVCSITKIDPGNIEKGRAILSSLPKPTDTRRQMLYYLCSARVHERFDQGQAMKFARKALDLADDGSYYHKEIRNIKNYLDELSKNINNLPLPEI